MFKIKICGITNIPDAIAAIDAGADAIGLNFFPESPRCVSIETAGSIVQAAAGRIQCIGVFVNSTENRIRSITSDTGLNAIQLHGDETVELVTSLIPIPVIKAFRIHDQDLSHVLSFLQRIDLVGATLHGILLDSYHPTQFGGTGQTVSLPHSEHRITEWGRPWCLAGGLRPENVGRAIQEYKPNAVDTASGVESSPGRKDASAIQRFVTNARTAFASIG
jgi:phosphoribosylanthranilate isomerase